VEDNSEEKELEQRILGMRYHVKGETMGDSKRKLRGLS
jgi:hypothetical protein